MLRPHIPHLYKLKLVLKCSYLSCPDNDPASHRLEMGGEMFTSEKKKISVIQICLAVVMMLSLTAVNFTPVAASSGSSGSTCDTEYVVQWGDNLYRIGLRFGVSWPEIAANNGIGYPYWVYAGQTLCISGQAGGTSGSTGVSIFVTDNIVNRSVSIETSRLPKHEIFDVYIGTCSNTSVGGTAVGKIKTDGNPGVFTDKFAIPSSLHGVSCLAIRISSRISSRAAFATFVNGSGVEPAITALSFNVTGVARNKTVTISVSHAIAGKKYKVYITPAGKGASGGTLVETIVPGKTSFTDTYTIPAKYKGASKLDIRIQGVTTSGVVYHTFPNTTH
jgi:hypothetical protein